MENQSKESTAKETDLVSLKLEDGILYGSYKPTHVTLKLFKQMLEDRLTYTQGGIYPLFADCRRYERVERDAWEFMAGKEGCKDLTAVAFLINSPVQKVIYNIYFSLMPPIIPVRSFTNAEAGIVWLKKYRVS
ncbi:hypothetical protein RCC89_12955 [Cytophagaceae bacterium ABcell3]|nr:hypothetical protein RCC89_12955 [Cytophagaceae bacterium ABcell3]